MIEEGWVVFLIRICMYLSIYLNKRRIGGVILSKRTSKERLIWKQSQKKVGPLSKSQFLPTPRLIIKSTILSFKIRYFHLIKRSSSSSSCD